ncbi:MAG: hypothetical protein LBF38_00515 [Deltaproteobacteria bacterium]|jgi:Tfp pilus assembly protein PilX|nr:hypothetical protein [Deltaproteobacteria bacterium]
MMDGNVKTGFKDFWPISPSENRPKPGFRRGVTLVEILISVCILTLGCLAAIQMKASTLKSANMADNITAATFLAEAELERLKSLLYEELLVESDAGTTLVNKLNRLGQTCTDDACDASHIFSRKVDFFPGAPTNRSCQVEITIGWDDDLGTHSFLYSGAITSLSF